MKKIVCIIMSLLLLLTGCGSVIEKNTEEKIEDTVTIGFCFDTFVIERWQKDRDVFVSQVRELGADTIVQNANGSVEEQINQIEYLISKGVDVIVIVPIESEPLVEVIEKAKKAGIKVVSYDRLCTNCNLDLYITFDNKLVGTLMGENMAKAIGDDKNVIMINGSPNDNNVYMVEEGFKEQAAIHGFNIIDEIFLDNWDALIAYDYVNENLDKIKECDGIMCGNDAVATQVIRALTEYQLNDNVVVVGQDADLDACQHIVEGLQYMTVYKNVNDLASEAAKLSVQLANEGSIDADNTINNGKYDIAYVALVPDAVTAKNMEAVIVNGGFHSSEEVYMNVK